MAGYRVLVVQREPFALTSIVNALVYRGLDVVGRAATAREALDLQRDQEPEVAVLDLDLGSGPSGIELAHALRIQQPDIGLVMLSSFRDPRLFAPEMSVLPLGAAYVCKSDVDDFGAVADRVMDAARSPLEVRTPAPNTVPSLTNKQISVLRLVAQGKSSQAIASELQMTPKAVEQSISKLSEILGVPKERSVNQRVRLARAYLTLSGKLDDRMTHESSAGAGSTGSAAARAWRNRSTAFKVVASVAGVAVVLGIAGIAVSANRGQDVSKLAGVESPCTPVLMVVRHGEDMANPAGGADILSPAGKKHAALYPMLFADYVATTHGVGPGGAKVSVCPIGRIIAIDPIKNGQNPGPGTNPYETIKPLADSLGLTIETMEGPKVSYSTVYDWTAERRKTLLTSGTSTVIAWDKQGLNPSADDLSGKSINGKKLGDYGFVPLLKAMPTDPSAIVGSGGYFTPNRTDLYVFSLQDPTTGQFGYGKTYAQKFSDDGGATWYDVPGSLPESSNPNAIKS